MIDHHHVHEAWEIPIRHFCESIVDPSSPEYFSAFSSLGITFFACLCLFTGQHNNALVKICAGVLAWCGIGSFGFHWTLSEAWSFLDTFPMTVAACLGIYLSFVVILEEWYQYGESEQEGKKKNAGVRLLRRKSHMMSLLALCVSGLLIWSLVLNVVYGNVFYDMLFSFLGLILMLSALTLRSCHRRKVMEARHNKQNDRQKKDSTDAHTQTQSVVCVGGGRGGGEGGVGMCVCEGEAERKIDSKKGVSRELLEPASLSPSPFSSSLAQSLLPTHALTHTHTHTRPHKHVWIMAVKLKEAHYTPILGGETQALSIILLGLTLVTFAACVWETSEQLCPFPSWHWLRHLHLHSLWHLSIGYGVYLLLQASALLSAPVLYGKNATFDNTHTHNRWINTLFPRVVYWGCGCGCVSVGVGVCKEKDEGGGGECGCVYVDMGGWEGKREKRKRRGIARMMMEEGAHAHTHTHTEGGEGKEDCPSRSTPSSSSSWSCTSSGQETEIGKSHTYTHTHTPSTAPSSSSFIDKKENEEEKAAAERGYKLV